MERTHIDPRIEKAIQLLEKNPSCTLQDLEFHCRMSTSRLTHVFKRETGGTIKRYRREHRLREAARMLTLTDMSVKKIAYHVGYQHTSSFVRAFEAEFGLPPTRYRERLAPTIAA
jgi:AraC family transcriptional regulator of arabinose operon